MQLKLEAHEVSDCMNSRSKQFLLDFECFFCVCEVQLCFLMLFMTPIRGYSEYVHSEGRGGLLKTKQKRTGEKGVLLRRTLVLNENK